MLAVIQQQEQVLITEKELQVLGESSLALLTQAKRQGNRRKYLIRVIQGSQRHKTHPMRKGLEQTLGNGDGQARLADAASAHHCKQTHFRPYKQGSSGFTYLIPTDERSERGRQIMEVDRRPLRGSISRALAFFRFLCFGRW